MTVDISIGGQHASANIPNRTYLDTDGISGYWKADHLYLDRKEYYRHLDLTNQGKNGTVWWKNDVIQRISTNRDLIRMVAEELGLTKGQKATAESYFRRLKLGDFGIDKEIVACSLCLYLIHTDKRDTRKCHPKNRNNTKEALYDTACLSYGLFYKDLKKTYGKVQHKCSNWSR